MSVSLFVIFNRARGLRGIKFFKKSEDYELKGFLCELILLSSFIIVMYCLMVRDCSTKSGQRELSNKGYPSIAHPQYLQH